MERSENKVKISLSFIARMNRDYGVAILKGR